MYDDFLRELKAYTNRPKEIFLDREANTADVRDRMTDILSTLESMLESPQNRIGKVNFLLFLVRWPKLVEDFCLAKIFKFV